MSNEVDKLIESHRRSIEAADRVIGLLEKRNKELEAELDEKSMSNLRAKEIALEIATKTWAFNPLGGDSSGQFLAHAENIYQWLISDSIKQDSNDKR